MSIGVYILLIFALTLGFVFLYSFHTNKVWKRRYDRICSFDNYIAILQYHMEKAYEVIYKDRILIYSLEATKLNNDEFQVVAKDFAALVLTMLGPTLLKELTFLYGNEETLYFNITEHFNTKFDDDEIRKTTQENLMSKELE